MDVSHINTNVLRKLLSLTEQKEALQEKLASIDAEIAALTAGKTGAKQVGRSAAAATVAEAPKVGRRRGAKRGRRGALKEQILSILATAGESGARVRDIADQLGINPQNIHVWFSSTGKKLAEIARVDAGHYRLIGAPAAEEPAPKSSKAPGKAAKKTKAKRAGKGK